LFQATLVAMGSTATNREPLSPATSTRLCRLILHGVL
jgi:hypothetical protein